MRKNKTIIAKTLYIMLITLIDLSYDIMSMINIHLVIRYFSGLVLIYCTATILLLFSIHLGNQNHTIIVIQSPLLSYYFSKPYIKYFIS